MSECSVSARVFCECCWWQHIDKSRPRQAQEPCPAFPSLLQLIPARSGPRSLAQLPRGSGRVPSIQGASQRSYKAQESFSVPRDVPRWSPGHDAPSALRNCAQDWKPYVFWHWKNSKLNILFLYLTFKKLKSCFSCFYYMLQEVSHIGFLLPVSHVCLQIAFPVSHIGFTISSNFYNFNVKGNWRFTL